MELDVDPEDPEVLIMTCLVSFYHSTDDDGDKTIQYGVKFSSWRVLLRMCCAI